MLKVCSFGKFLKITVRKKIVCIGVGKYISNLYSMQSREDDLFKRIDVLIDNSLEKQGKKYIIGGNLYEIQSIEYLKNLDPAKYVILITCLAEESLLTQINDNKHYSKFDVYCLRHFMVLYADYLALQKKIPENLRLSEKPLIPKIIHYCWFGGNPIPPSFKKCIESWKKFCPDYEIKEWNESNYDITKNQYMYEAYKAKKWGFVPDYARLDIIYNNGGIYLDTDVEIIQNIDELLYQKAFAGFQSPTEVAFGLGFGAIKGLEIIKELRNSYDTLSFRKPTGELMLTASPYFQTQFLKAKGLIQNGECQLIGDLTIYPEKMLCGKSYVTMQVTPAPYTRMVHHFAGSWCDAKVLKEIDDRTRIFNEIDK